MARTPTKFDVESIGRRVDEEGAHVVIATWGDGKHSRAVRWPDIALWKDAPIGLGCFTQVKMYLVEVGSEANADALERELTDLRNMVLSGSDTEPEPPIPDEPKLHHVWPRGTAVH